jgi:hypothetical protein
MHKVATRSYLPNPDLENDQTHVTLRDSSNRSVAPLYCYTATVNGAAASPNK